MAFDNMILLTELVNDPLSRTYSSMTDKQVAADLNTEYRTTPVASVSAADIFEAIDRLEFATLSADQQTRVDRILSLGEGIRVDDSQARDELLDIFGAGTDTRTNLAALQTSPVSRGQELGLGTVTEGDVIATRDLM